MLAGPSPSRPSTSRRVGSASAWTMPFSRSECCSVRPGDATSPLAQELTQFGARTANLRTANPRAAHYTRRTTPRTIPSTRRDGSKLSAATARISSAVTARTLAS